ncbi:hypothetical protein [Pyxidicoccus xibeiensis]|uniref:hypothetical protein n=1 Tax=Pyxidicoccus xibeiensis TaxID=2906759 RepID=UPI0020A79D32|nr:hypothetical protein [Pyxidicoccus xibeiensis]MCP3143586.1 hypothetical protein [Pyxidicoccus xibeiensis]
MDEQGTQAGAVSVDEHGRILKVGTEQEVLDGLDPRALTFVRLEPQQVLMPGFIEPHMHLLAALLCPDAAGAAPAHPARL